MVLKTVGEEKRDLFLKYFSFNKNIENDRFRCCPYCYNSFNLFSRSDAAEEKLAQTSSYLQDCLSKQLFIEKHKVTGQKVPSLFLLINHVTFSYLFHSFTLGLYIVLGFVFLKGTLY